MEEIERGGNERGREKGVEGEEVVVKEGSQRWKGEGRVYWKEGCRHTEKRDVGEKRTWVKVKSYQL